MHINSFFTKALILALFVFINSTSIFAQPKNFGDVSVLDFSSYNPEYDSTASAVVLFEKGEIEFDSDYNCILKIHKRIKILNDEGFEYGDIEVAIYNDAEQDVYGVKAVTYTLLPNGRIEENKLGRRDVFKTRVNEDYEVEKFTMPGLSSGVVIEYQYTKNMGNPFYLPDWRFHDYIPVLWSELDMIIPLSLNYQMIFKGKDKLFIHEATKLPGKVNNVSAQRVRLAKKDLPAVENLPYLINRDDHISEVFTQLNTIRIPGMNPRNYFKSWEDIAEELNNRGDFGGQKSNGAIQNQVKMLITDEMSNLDKVEAIYNYMINNFEWDGSYRLTTENGIRDTFQEKKGDTGDLNLLLVEMLREAGVKASPALLSTRANGTVLTEYSLISQFNMVVAAVEFGNSAFVVDVSSGLRSFRFPHPKILYRNAFVIREDDSYGWLTTIPIDKTYERMSMEYSLSDSSRITVKMIGNETGAFSGVKRQNVKSINFKQYWENEYKDLPGLVVDSANFENLQNLNKNVTYETTFSFDKDESFNLDQDVLYFQPLLFLKLEQNPFKKPTRELPIEFSYPYSIQQMVKVEIPDGYVVEELPESVNYMLPNGGGYYRFITGVTGNILTAVSTTSISQIYYSSEEYSAIKELFQAKVDATTGMVVLKKESPE
tara:strand:+ start:15564 stop:17534 length:1971 start_codon:yes stop_codon:yes gene_type:complete